MPEETAVREFLAALLRRRGRAYRRTFAGRDGQAVLADLRNFCCATRPSFQPGDPYATALREGRREVWLRLQMHLNMSEKQIWQLEADHETE
jgi:hypothetical protein